jgi:hypothetical protein
MWTIRAATIPDDEFDAIGLGRHRDVEGLAPGTPAVIGLVTSGSGAGGSCVAVVRR